jgi:hypothetical protein
MSDYDWTKFCKRIDVNSPTDIIYMAIATQAGFESWFLRTAEFTASDGVILKKNEFIKKDDTYRWLWFGYGDETEERGTILEANGTDQIKFTFAENCTVTITIKPEQGTTIVELWQENIPTDDKSKSSWHLGCSIGWTFYLANLKSVLEGGIDLRNKNEALRRVVNS